MSEPLTPSLIVVDDDAAMANIVGHAAKSLGFDVRVAVSAKAFMALYNESQPSAIVMEIVMPGMDGIELIEWLAEKNCASALILISGYGKYYVKTASHLALINDVEIIGTLMKPFGIEDLDALLQPVLDACKI